MTARALTQRTKLFSQLDRLGPGSIESLRWALGVAQIRQDARVLDAGCGTGADLRALEMAVPEGRVVAIDREASYVARAKARFPRIEAHVGDMLSPPGGPFDLIWSAGSVCDIGLAQVLDAWRPHLAPGGRVAFSGPCWRAAQPSTEAVEFWAGKGCSLSQAPELDAMVGEAGWRLLGARWLGAAGWSTYYAPLEAALDDAELEPELLAALKHEIEMWRIHGLSYGYRILVCEPG